MHKPLVAHVDRCLQAFGGIPGLSFTSLWWQRISFRNVRWNTWIAVCKPLVAYEDRRSQAVGGKRGSSFTTLCWQTHYTFDFGQLATIPHHAREVGALYFKVPRRIQLFGIAAEAMPSEHNYKFDEHQAIGIDGSKSHGPNSVLSMLHFHLEQYSVAKTICLHADNCCRQNKNKTVIAYLAWLVIVGLNEEIELSFMRVGHTRCFVDGGFGLLKQRYRKRDELRRDLRRHQIDVCTLQETKLSSDLDTEEGGYRFICPAPEW